MRLTFAALLAAAALAASAAPAAACGYAICYDQAIADDTYFPGETALPPTVQILVKAREDGGLSSAGFYNDPGLALAHREYAHPVVYGGDYAAAPVIEPAYATPWPHGHYRHRHHHHRFD